MFALNRTDCSLNAQSIIKQRAKLKCVILFYNNIILSYEHHSQLCITIYGDSVNRI